MVVISRSLAEVCVDLRSHPEGRILFEKFFNWLYYEVKIKPHNTVLVGNCQFHGFMLEEWADMVYNWFKEQGITPK